MIKLAASLYFPVAQEFVNFTRFFSITKRFYPFSEQRPQAKNPDRVHFSNLQFLRHWSSVTFFLHYAMYREIFQIP